MNNIFVVVTGPVKGQRSKVKLCYKTILVLIIATHTQTLTQQRPHNLDPDMILTGYHVIT